MTESVLNELVYRHIKGVDKWYRLYMGLESKLTNFENDSLFLTIKINPKWKKDFPTTARQIANDWRRFNPELYKARSYAVTIIQISYQTGFVLSKEQVENKSLLQQLIDNFMDRDFTDKNSYQSPVKILGTFEEI